MAVQRRKAKVNTKNMIRLPNSKPGEVYEVEKTNYGYRLRRVEKEPTPNQLKAMETLAKQAVKDHKEGKTIPLDEAIRRLGLSPGPQIRVDYMI